MTTRICVADHDGLVGSAQKRRLERDKNTLVITTSHKDLLRRIRLRKPGPGLLCHSLGTARRRKQTVISRQLPKSNIIATIGIAIGLFIYQSVALAAVPSSQEGTPVAIFGATDRPALTTLVATEADSPGNHGNILISDQSNKVSSTATNSLAQMNAGLNDAWYNTDTSGQGFFITVFPDIGYVSLSWFTYDTVRPDEDVRAILGEPGHRWLNALGRYSGNRAVMDISIASGGIFDTPTEIAETNDGTIILTFSDCNNGEVRYDIPSVSLQGVVPIQRVVGDNIALCEEFAQQGAGTQKTERTESISQSKNGEIAISDQSNIASVTPPDSLVQMNVGLNDAWYNRDTSGQGFFITVFPDIEYVLLSWFTYDTVRPDKQVRANLGESGHRWFNALGAYSGNQATMDITIASGGILDTPTQITEVYDGTIVLTFEDCKNGTVEYDIPSIDKHGVVPVKRVVEDNVALCEALNVVAPAPGHHHRRQRRSRHHRRQNRSRHHRRQSLSRHHRRRSLSRHHRRQSLSRHHRRQSLSRHHRRRNLSRHPAAGARAATTAARA